MHENLTNPKPEVSFRSLCAIATRTILANPTIDDVEWKDRVKDHAHRDGFRTPTSEHVYRVLSAVEYTPPVVTARTPQSVEASRRAATSRSRAQKGESVCPHQPRCATFHECRATFSPPPTTPLGSALAARIRARVEAIARDHTMPQTTPAIEYQQTDFDGGDDSSGS